MHACSDYVIPTKNISWILVCDTNSSSTNPRRFPFRHRAAHGVSNGFPKSPGIPSPATTPGRPHFPPPPALVSGPPPAPCCGPAAAPHQWHCEAPGCEAAGPKAAVLVGKTLDKMGWKTAWKGCLAELEQNQDKPLAVFSGSVVAVDCLGRSWLFLFVFMVVRIYP